MMDTWVTVRRAETVSMTVIPWWAVPPNLLQVTIHSRLRTSHASKVLNHLLYMIQVVNFLIWTLLLKLKMIFYQLTSRLSPCLNYQIVVYQDLKSICQRVFIFHLHHPHCQYLLNHLDWIVHTVLNLLQNRQLILILKKKKWEITTGHLTTLYLRCQVPVILATILQNLVYQLLQKTLIRTWALRRREVGWATILVFPHCQSRQSRPLAYTVRDTVLHW